MDTESELFEGEVETHESPYIVAPPTCHIEESEGSGSSGVRSTTTRMAVHVPGVISPCLSTGIAEVATMFDSVFRKRSSEDDDEVEKSLDSDSESEEAKDEGPTSEDEDPTTGDEGLATRDEGLGMGVKSRGLDDKGHSVESDGFGLGEEKVVPEGQQRAVSIIGTIVSESLGLGKGSGSAPKPKRSERVSASRQPTHATWTDSEDNKVYIDVPTYPPPTPSPQTSPSPEWSFGLFPISSTYSIDPSPIPSPMISLIVPSPIASYVATSTATIPIDEDQFIEVGAQLELYRSILQDHTQRLDTMPPTLFAKIDRDSLENEHERTAMTFGALWRPVLALEAWIGRVDTQMTDMSRAGYDDHRLVHDMLLQL
nr:hypothetical protein [Tanacetum cinerariifolium]